MVSTTIFLTLASLVLNATADTLCWSWPKTTTVFAGAQQPQGARNTVKLSFGEQCAQWTSWYDYQCVPCGQKPDVVESALRSFSPPQCGFKRCNSDGCTVPGSVKGWPGVSDVREFFAESCLQHDFCLADRGSPLKLADCNKRFLNNMNAQCDTLEEDIGFCKIVSAVIAGAVDGYKPNFGKDRDNCSNGAMCGTVSPSGTPGSVVSSCPVNDPMYLRCHNESGL
ncbi:hypothetical protein HDU99_004582 [Rhizoclosmatium hyalinum]|nr:hypothetical protein HDU99_004582 [Rhizoclosmatium hyalinum]